jgi:hypothetical protein
MLLTLKIYPGQYKIMYIGTHKMVILMIHIKESYLLGFVHYFLNKQDFYKVKYRISGEINEIS